RDGAIGPSGPGTHASAVTSVSGPSVAGGWWSLRCPISLQKSQIARRQFSCCKKIRPTTADRCGLNHVTEGASEFIFRQLGPPHLYTKVASTAKRIFDRQCKKTFATKSVETRCGAVAVGRTYLLPPLSS